jgi:large subunit ribosomal protein L23
MELSIFDIIKCTVDTPKSVELRKKFGKITFFVNLYANKILIRKAVEQIWNVKVDDVRIINLHGKNKAFGRRPFVSSDVKKAIVSLKKGYKIDLAEQFETMGVEENKASKNKG